MAKHKNDTHSLQHAFIQQAEIAPNSCILDLGWGGQSFVADRVASGSEVFFVGDDVRSVRRCGSDVFASYHLHSPDKVPGLFKHVFYHPAGHAAKGQVFHWIDIAFEKMERGGTFYLAGQKDRGVLSYVKYLAAVFGQSQRVARTGRMQYFSAIKTQMDSLCEPTEIEHLIEGSNLTTDGLQFKTLDGVFSRDGIDPGSRLLLKHIVVKKDAEVMDVGCGYGLLGIVCAKRVLGGHVWMGDVSARAVACAQENVELNKVTNASVAVSDLYEAPADQQFDLIVSNPPFHEGNQTGWPLIDGAFDRLKQGGELMIVVMRSGPYMNRMQTVFGDVDMCAEQSGYVVLRAKKKT